MRKREIFYLICTLFIVYSCNPNETTPSIQFNKLNYPSASSVEYYNNKLYVMGDDATDLLVLDTNLNVIDSIPILSYTGKRIPKDIKPDLEASALYTDNAGDAIFLLGSGSMPPRNYGWWYYFQTKIKDSIILLPLYSQIQRTGVEQINIEGACFLYKQLILSSRGNKSYPKNQLVIAGEISDKIRNSDTNFQLRLIPLTSLSKDTSSFHGVSDLCYSQQSDKLIMTISTEDTRSTSTDGPIGKSYLWIINNMTDKINDSTITADQIVDLEKISPGFKGQKIEAAAIINETKNAIRLVLVADNDDGSSTVFKITIRK